MADTKHSALPVESDGLNYRGIFWFLVILTITGLFCEGLVWGMLDLMEYRSKQVDVARAPLAPPVTTPTIENGHVVSGTANPPAPGLLVNEPEVLNDFRAQEDAILSSYAIDPTTGRIQIPIDRAKALVLQRGLPTRPAAAAPGTSGTGQ
ncbi:MAG TPA: hypothetical protein VG538_03925 [Vicinamibacterales bacterium]|jgi:hypothetical protein|nr:hypothetical protein [Vicinamibacterales bacterium]